MSTERRPDQLRDKDVIQRECISAWIDGLGVEIAIHREFRTLGQLVVALYEPTTSKNVGSPKIQLKFDDETQLLHFLTRCDAVLQAFRKNGSTTTEDLKIRKPRFGSRIIST